MLFRTVELRPAVYARSLYGLGTGKVVTARNGMSFEYETKEITEKSAIKKIK